MCYLSYGGGIYANFPLVVVVVYSSFPLLLKHASGGGTCDNFPLVVEHEIINTILNLMTTAK